MLMNDVAKLIRACFDLTCRSKQSKQRSFERGCNMHRTAIIRQEHIAKTDESHEFSQCGFAC